MTRDNLCHAFMVIMGVGAIYLNCVEPMVGRPYGQPALVSDHAAYGGDGPTGFDQAHGHAR